MHLHIMIKTFIKPASEYDAIEVVVLNATPKRRYFFVRQ